MDANEKQNPAEGSNGCQLNESRGTSTLARRTGGPRTPAGKQRSKYNARKHGIFSTVVVLDEESRAEYQSLLNDLRDSFRPVGGAENLLVEKLAAIAWRQRRLLIAEGAEIRKNQELREWYGREQLHNDAEKIASNRRKPQKFPHLFFQTRKGLIRHLENPSIMRRCLELLNELVFTFQKHGFNWLGNHLILSTIYGNEGDEHLYGTLYERFITWARTSEASEEERTREGYVAPEECKENFMTEIYVEIHRLKRIDDAQSEVDAARAAVDKLRYQVPDGPALDRLLRYETTLERSFDRTLGQLERLQRMRLGQPVPPPVKLEVTRN